MLGDNIAEMPTDSKNLRKSIKTTTLVVDPRLRLDLATLEQSMGSDVKEFILWQGRHVIADCLTKKGASSEQLLRILQTGQFWEKEYSQCYLKYYNFRLRLINMTMNI